MAEVLLVAIILAIYASHTMTADLKVSSCPSLCTCEKERIVCPFESLPVKIPPESTYLRVSNRRINKRAVVMPPNAFRLSRKNENLTIIINTLNISKISAHAFSDLKVIKMLSIRLCHIGELESFSFSNFNVTRFTMSHNNIKTIHQFAFHKLTSKLFNFYRSNVTLFSSYAFNQLKIAKFIMIRNRIAHVGSNAFGLWQGGIDNFTFRYNTFGLFECNEASNKTSVAFKEMTVNCSCSIIWILKNTSSFYEDRSLFKCQEKPGVSLIEVKDDLLMSCVNQTEFMDQLCSQRKTIKTFHGEPVKSVSTRHLMTMTLSMFICLSLLEINAFIP